MSLTIHCKYKYFDSTVQGAEDRRQKFNFCRLPFAVNVMLKLSISSELTGRVAKRVCDTCMMRATDSVCRVKGNSKTHVIRELKGEFMKLKTLYII